MYSKNQLHYVFGGVYNDKGQVIYYQVVVVVVMMRVCVCVGGGGGVGGWGGGLVHFHLSLENFKTPPVSLDIFPPLPPPR